MPGQVWGLATHDPAGPVFVTGFSGSDLDTTALTAVDPAGTVMWQRTFEGRPRPPRVTPAGTVWLALHGPTGYTFTEVGPEGRVLRSVLPEHQAHEYLGAFALLPDGFCTIWLPADPYRQVPPGQVPRVARHTATGATTWSAHLPAAELSFPGVVEAGVDTGWELRPKKPWRPQTISVGYRDPLLVSADRVLVSIEDGSGIGVCTILDATTGGIVTVTPPAPYKHKAISGPGSFLVGQQGYGAFTTTHYDAEGHAHQTWPSHAMMLVDRHGTVSGPESENILPSRSRFRVLNADGSLRDGPPLSGYHTTHPALDADGTAVFWRDGRLLAVDADLQARTLYAQNDDRSVMSRILLLDQGRVVFTLHDELFLFHGTGLGPLDDGPWPCGDGNLHGNPVRA
ncbi:hypothetical protein [Actinoplanes sp. NBRC 101535]|uniref:hypothetical protein n=1 Tax=Actinoplanes sp. NBRC 101535 TaxID=3032196 RepID=UPI0025553694|nr:hypothetical protein [Actinoplanes sp. NBRC 101535]